MKSRRTEKAKQLTRRHFLKGSGVAAAEALVGLMLSSSVTTTMAGNGEDNQKRRNVLFISVDDLRPQLGCYGQQQMITPNLDRLAAGGVIFTNHFVQCPACAPSRYSLLTSQRPHRSRLKSYTMKAFDLMPKTYEGHPVSLPHQFKLNGYYTVSIGKISHSPDGRRRGPSIKGVDAYDGVGDGQPELPFGWDEVYAPFGPWRTAWGAFFAYAGGKTRELGKTPSTEAADVPDTGYPDGLIAEEAIKKLRELKDKPFFLAVGFYKPHLPFNCPKEYWDAYERDKIKLAPHPNPPKNIDPNISLHKSYELTPRYAGLATPGNYATHIMPAFTTLIARLARCWTNWVVWGYVTILLSLSGAITAGIWEITASGAKVPPSKLHCELRLCLESRVCRPAAGPPKAWSNHSIFIPRFASCAVWIYQKTLTVQVWFR